MNFQVDLVRLENMTTDQSYLIVIKCGEVEAQSEEIPDTITMNDTNGEYVYFDVWTIDWVWQGSGRLLRASIRQSRLKPVKLRRVAIRSNLTLVLRLTQIIELNLDQSRTLSRNRKMNETVSVLSSTSRWTESLRQRKEQEEEEEEKKTHKRFEEEHSSFLFSRRLKDLATPKSSPTKRVPTHRKHTSVAFGRHETKDISNVKEERRKNRKKGFSKTSSKQRSENTRLLREKLSRRKKSKRKPRECTC